MKTGFRVPIATKLAVPAVLLVAATAMIIATQSSDLFEKTSRQRENDINMSEAMARGIEAEQVILGLIDKVHMLGSFATENILRELSNDSATLVAPEVNTLRNIFMQDRDIVSLEIANVEENHYGLLQRFVREDYLLPYGLNKDYIASLRSEREFPWLSLKAGSIEVRSSSVPGKAPLFTIGVPVMKNELGQVTHVAIADIRLSRLQQSFSQKNVRTVYLLDAEGRVLAHTNENHTSKGLDYSGHPLQEAALKSEFRTGQLRFIEPGANTPYIGAYSRLGFGLLLISQIKESVILQPSQKLRRDAYYIAGILVSAALLIILLGSLSLTLPLERLVALTKEIAQGNFDVGAKYKISSKDEVGDLASSFDEMAIGLKERDKVKSLFSKFHGSQVAEDLIGKDIALSGVKKDVTVFFSDIRGFTSFSESRPPEEVVELLNAYFGRMVEIINRRGGIVDKFIGDAIMAVWGVPNSTEDDAYNAIFAALEMRQAMDAFNDERLMRGQESIRIGMGVHSGRAISGTIGSEERMEYTVIGDTVNVAARIETATKSFGVDLLISATTAERLKDRFHIESAGQVEVKGKSEALSLYKVHGYYDHKGELIIVKSHYSDYAQTEDSKARIA